MTPERLQFIEARVHKNESAPDLPDLCRELIAFAKDHVKAKLPPDAVVPGPLVGEPAPNPPGAHAAEDHEKQLASHRAAKHDEDEPKHKTTHHGKK